MKETSLQVEGLRFRTHSGQGDSGSALVGSVGVGRGGAVVIVGPVGCGKSEAALCLCGLREPGEWGGRMVFDGIECASLGPLERAALVALVPSNPTLVFSCISKSVVREMELSCQFLGRGVSTSEILKLLDRLDLTALVGRDPLTLSGGEKIRAAIGVCLAKSPQILVVDQVFEELDSVSEHLIRSVLDQERMARGLIVVEFHSRAPAARGLEGQSWMFITPAGLVQGSFGDCWGRVAKTAPELLPRFPRIGALLQRRYGITYNSPPVSEALVLEPFARRDGAGVPKAGSPDRGSAARPCPAAVVSNLEFSYLGQAAFRLGPVSHSFPAGRATAVLGRNGAGKTTLLRCLGNLNQGWRGEVSLGVDGPARSDPLHIWARHALYCFQNPDDQLFFTTVRAELAETARRIRHSGFAIEDEVRRVASGLGLASILDAAPLDLPRASRRLVTLGSALVAAPGLLLLDEPTGGLDGQLTGRLVGLLREYLDGGGTIVMVSHDYDFVGEVADDVLVLENGGVKAFGARECGFSAWPGESRPGVVALARSLGMPEGVWREGEFFQQISPKPRG